MEKVILSEYLKNHRLSKQDICDYVICVNNMMLKTGRTSTICFDSENVYVTHENPLILEFSVSESLNIDAHYEISKNLLKLLRHTDVEDKEALHEGYDLFCRSSKDGYKMTDLLAICDKYADITLVNKTLESMSDKELSSIEEIKGSYKANKETIIEYKYKDTIYKIPYDLAFTIYQDLKTRSQVEYINELRKSGKDKFLYLKTLDKEGTEEFAAESKELEEIYALENGLPEEAVLQTIEKFKSREEINKNYNKGGR